MTEGDLASHLYSWVLGRLMESRALDRSRGKEILAPSEVEALADIIHGALSDMLIGHTLTLPRYVPPSLVRPAVQLFGPLYRMVHRL